MEAEFKSGDQTLEMTYYFTSRCVSCKIRVKTVNSHKVK